MTKPPNSKHRYGIAILLLGCLLNLNPYFLLFGVPVVLIGIGLILASDIDPVSKVTLSVVPPLAVGLFYCALLLG